MFPLPIESTLKRMGSKFFTCREEPFCEGLVVQESVKKVTEVVIPGYTNGDKILTSVSIFTSVSFLLAPALVTALSLLA